MTLDKGSGRKFPSGSASRNPVPRGLSPDPRRAEYSQHIRDSKQLPCDGSSETLAAAAKSAAEKDLKPSGNSVVID